MSIPKVMDLLSLYTYLSMIKLIEKILRKNVTLISNFSEWQMIT